MTLAQCYVPEQAFEAVCASIANITDREPLTAITLTAKAINSVSFEGLAVAVVVLDRTPELMRLHQQIVDAVEPFSKGGGSPAAFADPTVAAGTIDWVETFISKSSGKNYLPHITAGIASKASVADLAAAPFTPFKFQADGLLFSNLETSALQRRSSGKTKVSRDSKLTKPLKKPTALGLSPSSRRTSSTAISPPRAATGRLRSRGRQGTGPPRRRI